VKRDTIFRQLRAFVPPVPIDRARAAAAKYGDDTNPLSDTQKAQKAIAREARRIAVEFERRKFRLWCQRNDLPLPVFEYLFAKPERAFALDIAWVPEMFAIEVQGGIWRKGGGAHTGKGHLRDMEKLNLAQQLGWYVAQIVPADTYAHSTLVAIRIGLAVRVSGVSRTPLSETMP